MGSIDIVTKADLELFKAQLLDEIRQILVATPAAPKKWLKSNEACKILDCAASKLKRLRIKNQITYKRVGRVYYYSLANLQAA